MKEKNSNEAGKIIAHWLVGAFEPLEKQFLRELKLFVTLNDIMEPENVLEMYTFRLERLYVSRASIGEIDISTVFSTKVGIMLI